MEEVSGNQLHDLTEIHDRYTVTQLKRGRKIVSDEYIRTSVLSLQVLQEGHHLRLQGDVERTESLVQDHERRIRDKGSRDARPLLLTARQLVGVSIPQLRFQAYTLEHVESRSLPAPARALRDERLTHAVRNTALRVERARWVLEDHLQLAADASSGTGCMHVLPTEEDRSGRRRIQSCQDAGQRRLPAP